MASLCVYVNRGALDRDLDCSGIDTYVAVKIGDRCVCFTQIVRGAVPLWDREFVLETISLSQELSIELWQKKLFGQQLFGQIRVSLLDIGHRNKHDEGMWYHLWLLQNGQRESTKHRLQLDMHFELPHGLSRTEAEQLEAKLLLFNQILEDEIVVLREQAERIQRGEDSLPAIPQHMRPPGFRITQSPLSHSEPGSMENSGDRFSRESSLVRSSEVLISKPSGTQRYIVPVLEASGSSFNRDRSLSPLPVVIEPNASPKLVKDAHDSTAEHDQTSLDKGWRFRAFMKATEFAGESAAFSAPQLLDDRRTQQEDCVDSLPSTQPLSRINLQSSFDDDGRPRTPVNTRAMRLWHRAVDRVKEILQTADWDEVVESLPHLQLFVRKDGESSTRMRLVDVVLKAKRQNKEFFEEIESRPDVSMRDEVHELCHNDSLGQIVNRRASQSSVQDIFVGSRGSSKLVKDEELKHLVYRKALQALVYPISATQPHNFVVFSAKKPAYCFECKALLWGLARQGLRCSECGVKSHRKCMSLINADCLMRRAQKCKKHKDEDKLQRARDLMKERMSAREWNHKEVFEHLRDAFDVPDTLHQQYLKEAQNAILDGSSKWSAKVIVTVVEAHGLAAKHKHTASSPYVSITVGDCKKRTRTIPSGLKPVWDETFEFEARESSDRLKIRVWDEEDDLASKIVGKLIHEPDSFLGQVLIDVKSFSGELDIWHDLEGRTTKSSVSGAIRLRIVTIVEGEETRAPFYHQYSCLHEILFDYEYQTVGEVLIPAEVQETDSWKVFFREPAQEISTEFATRFGIDTTGCALTHFVTLVNVFRLPKVAGLMSDILTNVNELYELSSRVSAGWLPVVSAATFGRMNKLRLHSVVAVREEMCQTMELLYNQLKTCLINYREMFPVTDPQKLEDLRSSVNLFIGISFFNMKVLQLENTRESVEVLRECMQESARETYEMLKQDVLSERSGFSGEAGDQFPAIQAVPDKEKKTEALTGKGKKTIALFEQLLRLMVLALENDQVYFSPCFSHLGNFNLWHITAVKLWQLFEEDLPLVVEAVEHDIEDASEMPRATIIDAMNFLFKVKYVFKSYIAEIPEYQDAIPEFQSLLRVFVLRWLSDNDELQAKYVVHAVEADRESGFKPASQYHHYSSSVVDVFCSLTEMFKILKNLECPDPDLQCLYMAQFAGLIASVLSQYMDIIGREFVVLYHNNQMGAVMLSNVVEIRELLKEFYINMGGEQLGELAVSILHTLQNIHLAGDFDRFCKMFASSLDGPLDASVKTMKERVMKLKNTGNAVTRADTNEVIYDVMQTLSEWLQGVQPVCKTTAVKRLLKELWYLLLAKLEKFIILPPMPEELDVSKMEVLDLSERQVHVLDRSLEIFKKFFHGSHGDGLHMSFFEKCQDLGRLRSALELYRCSSDTLIVTFLKTERNSIDRLGRFQPVGWVCLQVSLFSPGDGEHRLTIKVVSVSDLCWPLTGAFWPYVEVNVLGPHMSARKRRQSTNHRSSKRSKRGQSTKSDTTSLSYNETFHFKICCVPEDCELHVIVKDYCIGRSDNVVGVAVLQLCEVVDLGSLRRDLPLNSHIHISDIGHAILGILYGRLQDDVVREFIQIKSTRRTVHHSEEEHK